MLLKPHPPFQARERVVLANYQRISIMYGQRSLGMEMVRRFLPAWSLGKTKHVDGIEALQSMWAISVSEKSGHGFGSQVQRKPQAIHREIAPNRFVAAQR